MNKRIIVGVQLTNRLIEVPTVQAIFTEFGCHIKTRLGLHQIEEDACSTVGIILLEMFGDESKINEMQDRLAAIEGVYVERMEFME